MSLLYIYILHICINKNKAEPYSEEKTIYSLQIFRIKPFYAEKTEFIT